MSDLECYLNEMVEPTVDDFRKNPASERHAYRPDEWDRRSPSGRGERRCIIRNQQFDIRSNAGLPHLSPQSRAWYDRRVDYIPDEIAAARIGR
jgi:hypothetical protein